MIDQSTGLTHDIATFGEDQNSELYIGTRGGQLYRIRRRSSPDPDLIITAVDGPLSGNLGATIQVATTHIQNQGAAAAGASTVGFYFSDDPQNQPRQTFSGSTCAVPGLGGGASHTCIDTTVNVPGSLPAGPRSLVAVADDTDVVAESDEDNNDQADPQAIELIDCGGSEICSDGVDNDCDGLTDSDDSDCQSACFAKGDACDTDGDCCSNKCRGPSGNRSCK